MAPSHGFECISEDEINELKNIYETEGVKGYESFLRHKDEQWKQLPLNIGVIGSSGVGKSSFINGIRDLDGDDEGAAAVGVTEQTTDPKPYPHPNNPNMMFWDLPGVGTNNFPQANYLERIGFDRFDFFLLLTSIRFTEIDAWLAQEISNNGKQFFFVRTKFGSDLDNDRKAHPKAHKKDSKGEKRALWERIISDLKHNLKDLYQQDKVFIVDSYETNMYDFPLLVQRLFEDFPKLKRQALIFSMNAFSEKIVQAKVAEIRSSLWKYASLSAGVAAIPIPGLSLAVDFGIIVSRSRFFFDQLGLDDASLEKMARVTGSNVMELKSIVSEKLDTRIFLTTQGIKQLIVTLPTVVASEAAEEVLRLIPFIGSLIAAPISFGTTYYLMTQILNKMEEVALLVVSAANQSISEDVTENENSQVEN